MNEKDKDSECAFGQSVGDSIGLIEIAFNVLSLVHFIIRPTVESHRWPLHINSTYYFYSR